MSETPSRKLAVILHADVVGSTALVQRNESVAHERIQNAFQCVSSTINRYDGIAHEIRGDALVAEFARASDAVSAALTFQAANTILNSAIEDDICPEIRVGISLGEVVIADGTVTGAGVVLAQRVEQLAEPGGMCITETVRGAIPERLPLDFDDLGEQELKGFDQPVRVHSVQLQPEAEIPSPEPLRATKRKQSSFVVPAIAVVILLAFVLAWFKPWVSDAEQTAVERSSPDKPSVAVLPFENLSDDPEQEYLSDGMAADLITDLSKVPALYVVSRSSSFRFKNKQLSPEQLGQELNVRYIVEGSVRRAAERLRINAQLTDTTTGYHLWAERFDWKLEDIFAAQDQLTEEITTALDIHLGHAEREHIVRRLTSNVDAYDYYLRGVSSFERYTKEGNALARQMFLKAIELDPKFVAAHGYLAATYNYDWDLQFDQVPDALDRAMESAQTAVALDPEYALGHQQLGWTYIWKKQPDKAIASGQQGVTLDPDDDLARALFGDILNCAGRPQEGLEHITKAIDLNPFHAFWYEYVKAHSYDLLGRQEEAIELMNKVLAIIPDFIPARRHLAVIYVDLNRMQEARAEIAEILRINPGYSISEWSARARYTDPAIRQRFVDNLRKASLPE